MVLLRRPSKGAAHAKQAAVFLAQVGAESLRWTGLSRAPCPLQGQQSLSCGVGRAGDDKDHRHARAGLRGRGCGGPESWGPECTSPALGPGIQREPLRVGFPKKPGRASPAAGGRGSELYSHAPSVLPAEGAGTGVGFVPFCCSIWFLLWRNSLPKIFVFLL